MDNYIQLFSLEGKKALITGGTGGLGGEIAKAFYRAARMSRSAAVIPKKPGSFPCMRKVSAEPV